MRDTIRRRGNGRSRSSGSKRKPATAATTSSPLRVAIYCRQSVDRGRSDEYGSTQAQREMVEAFILSQQANGWEPIPEPYIDSGMSGANANRPALQRLLDDVAAGKIDIVATYRLDRVPLTETLTTSHM